MQIDDILRKTGRHFGDLLSADANPLEVALALMDDSSIGKAMYSQEFDELQMELNDCLKQQVGSNFDGFNASISVYHTLVNTVNDNHQTVQDLEKELQSIRQFIKDRRPIVKEWQASSLRYKTSLDLLDTAEELKQVPDKYEGFISRKRFLEAHRCLTTALETMVSRNMLQYTSIEPIHSYVVQQQLSLAQIVQTEITNHLYLRSPWTENRWIYFPTCSTPEDLIQSRIRQERATLEASSALHGFLDKLKEPLQIDYSTSVESDSFTYIRLLVEMLGKIDRLDQVAEAIMSTVVVDLRRLVEKTISDFIKKEKISVESLANLPTDIVSQIQSPEYHHRLRVLEALASTIYSKLNAVLDGHRVVYELIKGRVQYNILHVYNAIEHEIGSLLASYIDTLPVKTRRKSFGSESRRSIPSKHHTKSEFVTPTFQYLPETMDAEIQTQFDKLRLSMKKWVPGLELTGEMDNGTFNPYADTHKESNLSVVAPANILNIRALAGPTASFLQCSRDTLSGQEQCTTRIDAFMSNLLNNSFLPNLKQTIERCMDDILEEEGALVYSNYAHESQLPIMDSAYKSVRLIFTLSCVLNTNAYYRPNYVDILITAMEMVRDFFGSKIKDGLAARNARPKAIQLLTTQESLRTIHRKLYGDETAIDDELQFYLKKILVHTNLSSRLTLNDLLDIDTFKMFTLLSTTIQWVTLKMRQIVTNKEESNDSKALVDSQVAYVRRWWALVDIEPEFDLDSGARIILSGESVERYAKIINHLEAYNRQVLSLLRADLMCRIVYHFDEMALKGVYDSPSEAAEHDADIELLQTNLATCHKLTFEYLLPADRKFVFAGCAKLMNELFILESNNIKGIINENGVRKMFSNILSLQQVLKSVASEPQDVDFLRSVEFYEGLRTTSARTIDSLRTGKSKLRENDVILLLQLKQKEDLAKSRDNMAVIAQFNDQVQQVKDIFAKRK